MLLVVIFTLSVFSGAFASHTYAVEPIVKDATSLETTPTTSNPILPPGLWGVLPNSDDPALQDTPLAIAKTSEPVPKTSTDTTMYYAVALSARALWSAPTITSIRTGTLNAGSPISYYMWTDDGTWVYTSDGKGGRVYFKGYDLEQLPPKTSTDTKMYYAVTLTSRAKWAAPSIRSSKTGSIQAGSYISYYKWSQDGTWLYASDANGRRTFFKGFSLEHVPPKTSTDTKMYYAVTLIGRAKWAAPSIRSRKTGTIQAGSYLSYYKWSDDGTWLYATDSSGRRTFFKGYGLESIPPKSSTDTKMYYGFGLSYRALWAAPSTRARKVGDLYAGTPLSYYKWSDDGTWMYTSDGKGGRVFFKGYDLQPAQPKTSTNTKMYFATVNSTRSLWSAPSILSRNVGSIKAGKSISYFKWTSDGTWLYTSDGKGGRVYFKGYDLSNVSTTRPGPSFFGTYIDVNLGTQKVNYAINGKVALATDVVTGAPWSPTPAGTFSILSKQSPAVLVGADYAAPVTFWMPFTPWGHGFHDANWQPWFGGNRWTYAGSHGCINMPYWAASELYRLAPTGTRVSIHW